MTKQRQRASAPMPETKRCAIYTRKSTTLGLEQDFNSLDAQRDSCLAYIERQPGWKLVDERYDDGGFTGANTDRPAFQRLMGDIDAGKVDVIVVYKVDRLSRSLLDFVKVMERLNTAGASFVSVTQNFSTADAMGRLTMNMLMSFAEFEREMISERTRDKIAGARRKGKWTGGPVPFGYSAKDKKLYVNEPEAHVVREAFTLFLQHRQMAVVVRELNRRGLPPRASRRTSKRGLLWTKDSIARVLRSPLYVGLMMHGDELFPGEHPPLIDESTHQQAQRLLGASGRELRVTGTNPEYVLRGLLRCGLCGEAMCPGSTTKKSGKAYRFYRCSTRDKFGKEKCSAKPLPAGAIEDFVVERIADVTTDGTLAERTKSKLQARIAKARADYVELRRALNTRIADCSATASKLADEVARLEGRARELVEAKLRIEANNLEAAESQLRAVDKDAVDLELDASHLEWFVNALRDFGNVWMNMTPENQGRLLRAVVADVRVNEETGVCRVELVNFNAVAGAREAA